MLLCTITHLHEAYGACACVMESVRMLACECASHESYLETPLNSSSRYRQAVHNVCLSVLCYRKVCERAGLTLQVCLCMSITVGSV